MDSLRAVAAPPSKPAPIQIRPTSGQPADRVELGRRRADDEVPKKIAEGLRRAGKTYYDASRDAKTQSRYYGNLLSQAGRLDSKQLFWRLNEVISESHNPRSYEPSEYLYTWVDLRPNLRLDCIYDPSTIEAGAPVRGKDEDFQGLQRQAAEWSQALAQGPTNALQIAQKIAVIETRSVFNCEHVVPRIWFSDRSPMRGDLHHLFTANQDTNGDRSSRRLFDFPEYDGSDARGLAPYGDTRYEPAAGKGPVARATLYFLLRYPRKVGDDPREIQPEDIQTLLRWNREDPPTLYERHRNQAIQDLQGNRNPFIDHPEWADRVDFTQGLQQPRPAGMQSRRADSQAPQKLHKKRRNHLSDGNQRPRAESSKRNRPKRRWRR